GAGRAPYALAVLQQSPGSTAVVNDLPGVIELAADTIAAQPDGADLATRVQYLPGDFHTIGIADGAFDVV
ncbi:MAG TPA: hypothetical protein PLV68_12905, partial [Ilumatobacteraceae bacterium]|nr:hypothetical protein [Ilumatobacteraceae bacterium]